MAAEGHPAERAGVGTHVCLTPQLLATLLLPLPRPEKETEQPARSQKLPYHLAGISLQRNIADLISDTRM